MSDLVGNPEDRFSRDAAHFKLGTKGHSAGFAMLQLNNVKNLRGAHLGAQKLCINKAIRVLLIHGCEILRIRFQAHHKT